MNTRKKLSVIVMIVLRNCKKITCDSFLAAQRQTDRGNTQEVSIFSFELNTACETL